MEVFTGTDYLSRKQDDVSHVTVSVGSHQERGSRARPFFNNFVLEIRNAHFDLKFRVQYMCIFLDLGG